jgi:hypothetical protein
MLLRQRIKNAGDFSFPGVLKNAKIKIIKLNVKVKDC